MPGALQHIRGDRWRVIVYAGVDELGKQRQRSKSFRAPSRQAAERMADRIRADLRDTIEEDRREPGTVGEYIERWLNEQETEKSPTTMKGYRVCAARITKQLGRLKLDELTPQHIRAWYAQLAKGDPKRGIAPMTQATIDHHHAVLRAVLRQAAKDGLVAAPATFAVRRPKPERVEVRLPRDADMLRLFGRASGDLAIAIRLAAATGMRRGELVALRWSDLEGREVLLSRAHIEADGGVRAKSTKGKRSRRIPLDHWTLRTLAEHRARQVDQAGQLGVTLGKRDDRFVLANMALDPTGQTAYSPSWLSHGWERVRAGSKVRLHDIRHWYATKLLESGQVTIAELSSLLGHAQTSTTMNVYAHVTESRRRVAATVMGGQLRTG